MAAARHSRGRSRERTGRRELQLTEQVPSQSRSASRADQATSGWAVGFILFAAIMMIMASLTVIALDVFVIWALAAHGREVAA